MRVVHIIHDLSACGLCKLKFQFLEILVPIESQSPGDVMRSWSVFITNVYEKETKIWRWYTKILKSFATRHAMKIAWKFGRKWKTKSVLVLYTTQ